MVRGVTTVVVTHDIESCKVADRIIVVEDGRIVQDGAFAGLADSDGRFASHLACTGLRAYARHSLGDLGEVCQGAHHSGVFDGDSFL